MTPEEILDSSTPECTDGGERYFIPEQVIKLMKEYARQERDKALDWAAENAELHYLSNGNWAVDSANINKESILDGKTHKDLEI